MSAFFKKSCVGLAAVFLSACVFSGKSSHDPSRSLSSESDMAAEVPSLVYLSYKNQAPVLDNVSSERWTSFSQGGREDFLLKLYYANTRNKSRRGLKHAACFHGSAHDVIDAFFNTANAGQKVRNVTTEWPRTKASADGRMLGIRLAHATKGSLFFRMMNCNSGKSSIIETDPKKISKANVRDTSEENISTRRFIASLIEPDYGFGMVDKVAGHPKLPRFKLEANYDRALSAPEERPWKDLDLKDPKQAILFALTLQKYFYEGMADQDLKNPDFNFIPEKNSRRYWCHMPWMHVGEAGREAIHGLTKERDLVPSKKIPLYSKSTPGSNWGVAYFNAPGCETLGRIFGTPENPKPVPEWFRKFKNGTVSTKILFTSADFPEIEGAYTWNANATDAGSPNRSVRPVKHIQMDISVKDVSLKGVSPALGFWAMVGFYYDPNYDYDKDLKPILGIPNPLDDIPNLPSGLKKMRPIGVQSGFDGPDTKDTITFPGAFANGSGGRLNGPADNPRTSCMGCHGAAGTGASMVPGFLSMSMFAPYDRVANLDFNQQLALAKENFETQIEP